MNLLGAWCMCLVVSLTNCEVEHGSCTGGSCEASDSTALLQSGLGVVDAIEAASEEVAEAQGNDDDDDGSPGSGDTDVDCSSFTTGSTCQSSGCSWSGEFVGEKKEDGSELSGYICADDEEVEEEVHDKLVNGTGSLTQMLEDESEISSKGNEERWCRRRRAGTGGGCPYCRRRRSPPPAPATIEADGCPTGLKANSKGKCPGSGQCCTAGWSAGCGQACVTQRCTSTGGSSISGLNHAIDAYTCEMPKPLSTPSNYSDEPKADNAGFDCLCAAGTGFCGAANTWFGTLAAAQAKCDGNAECKYLHDWKADGSNWRACRTIKSPGDGKAAIKKKSSSGTSAPLFDRMDADKSEIISREEFTKALAAGVISLPSSNKASPSLPPTSAPTTAPTSAPTTAPTSAPTTAPTTAPTLPPSGPVSSSFKRVDENNDKAISRGELNKAVAAGTVTRQR